jgi:hypothetical protein
LITSNVAWMHAGSISPSDLSAICASSACGPGLFPGDGRVHLGNDFGQALLQRFRTHCAVRTWPERLCHPFQRQALTICHGAAGETQLQNDVHGADEAAWRRDDRAVKFLGRDDLEVVLVDEETMERAFGWVFF